MYYRQFYIDKLVTLQQYQRHYWENRKWSWFLCEKGDFLVDKSSISTKKNFTLPGKLGTALYSPHYKKECIYKNVFVPKNVDACSHTIWISHQICRRWNILTLEIRGQSVLYMHLVFDQTLWPPFPLTPFPRTFSILIRGRWNSASKVIKAKVAVIYHCNVLSKILH